MDKHNVIVQAVEKLKSCEFGATAIKVELEANLRRSSQQNQTCGNCYNGRVDCPDCDGNYEGEYCYNCDSGRYLCDECDGAGFRIDEDDNEIQCEDCNEGYIECEECDGQGETGQCNTCDEGSFPCPDCEENGYVNFGNITVCQNYILEILAEDGLATYDGDKFVPQWPLVFAKFYNDGSVDSELTFTLALDDPENIFLLPKFLDAFNKLAEAVGNEKVVTGAGMHMALINSPDSKYPTRNTQAQENRARNFRKSMNALIPALYFLGSPNDLSRPMNYRRPGVGIEDKYKTISYRYGALEFRVFETCYDNPEAILDNIVVMSNAMKYWRDTYKPVKVGVKKYKFGLDSHGKLERMYCTLEHLDLLDKGLKILKPDYYTIKEVKQQRKFTRTRAYPRKREVEAKKDALLSYKEYENRFEWKKKIEKIAYEYREFKQLEDASRTPTASDITKARRAAAKLVADYDKKKTPLEEYVTRKIKENLGKIGQYELEVA